MMSKMTVGKKSNISRRSQAVPLDALFQADVQSVKARNDKKGNEDTESQKFGRWAMRNEVDKAEAIERAASNNPRRANLDPIAEV